MTSYTFQICKGQRIPLATFVKMQKTWKMLQLTIVKSLDKEMEVYFKDNLAAFGIQKQRNRKNPRGNLGRKMDKILKMYIKDATNSWKF